MKQTSRTCAKEHETSFGVANMLEFLAVIKKQIIYA
jgi:hypothetical protein